MNRATLARVLLGGAVVAGVAWFFATHERVRVTQDVGMSGEARLREFLAAQRLATRMGLGAREIRSVEELGRLAPGVLIVPRRRAALDANRLQQLDAWAGRGGHLIVEAELGRSDPLLDLLGVARKIGQRGGGAVVELELPQDARKLKVQFGGPLLDAPGKRLRLSAGTMPDAHLISFERGKGLVTVAGSLDFARNAFIAAHDHGELFWQLMQLGPAASLQVLSRPERLSLWRFLVEHALSALLAAAALLALWLWRIAPRFGPLLPDPPAARRRLLDHLRAAGRYCWSNGLRTQLAAAARDAALRRLARAQPDFAVAPPTEQAARIAALAGIPPADALQFLAARGALRGAEFIHLTQLAQRLHAALEKGNR